MMASHVHYLNLHDSNQALPQALPISYDGTDSWLLQDLFACTHDPQVSEEASFFSAPPLYQLTQTSRHTSLQAASTHLYSRLSFVATMMELGYRTLMTLVPRYAGFLLCPGTLI